MKILFYIVIAFAVLSALYLGYRGFQYVQVGKGTQPVACTMEAKVCPDGSVVGREGPNCEFAACPEVQNDIPQDVQSHIDSKADKIVVDRPEPYESVRSPLVVSGQARGSWFFEAQFPIVLVDWDGQIIGEGIATAEGEWMTADFVPFSATVSFDTPDYSPRGTLILQRSNASGLPEHDDALEIPIQYADVPVEAI